MGKKTIYYARTYRRLKLNLKENIILSCFLIIPALILLFLNVDNITYAITWLGEKVLSNVIPAEQIGIGEMEYSILNTVYYLQIPTTFPSTRVIWINIIVCLVIFLITKLLKYTGRPIAIYFMFSIFVQLVNCIYFLFAAKYFPYEASDYSYLYILQQVGIWWTFIVLAGLVVSFLGERGYSSKISTFFCILLYSIVFGVIRYILYVYILYRFSVLYMALLFFIIGPAFDFSYFVAIYARFINKKIKEYDHGDRKGEWEWS